MSRFSNSNNGKSKCNRKHLSLGQRKQLLECVQRGLNEEAIATQLGVHKTTVSRELLLHRKFFANRRKFSNRCEKVALCSVRNVCQDRKCVAKCKNCPFSRNCWEHCSEFVLQTCKRKDRFPYVCNGCTKASHCILDFYRYDPKLAHEEAQTVLTTSRRGINLSEEQFAQLDKVVTQGTCQGQSIEHIVQANKIDISPRTVRNYVSQGLLTTKKMDTPRGAIFKPRQKLLTPNEQRQMRTAKVGRDHSAFLKYAASEPFLLFTELDTVEGSKRDQDKTRLLTFIFVKVRLFFSVLIPDGLSASVARVFDALYEKLGLDDFKFMFGTLLTDNGSEFSNPERIEFSPSGERRSWVFYCNPYASWEKGAIEVCHELFRRIIPKGSSLKDLDDDKVCLINSHINSYIRESNGSMSAYDTFANAFPERAARILNLLKIQRILNYSRNSSRSV